ncbi:CWO-like protein [Mya arenaria]|uniref:CWO-like protein n=1 Tax=Mya arenaria TaxID=6604 RepID=A0ABY7FZD1_MYAAR|nr:CWO-like protein [Mya arenaria]WAR26176.1 CWO-like protein [Mya arenaria]
MNSIVMDFGAPASMMTQNCGERLMQISDPHGDRSLNFGTCHSEEFDMPFVKKPKTIRDPMSHRIIEKRRRDRMNNCLADLSRLIPTNYLKQDSKLSLLANPATSKRQRKLIVDVEVLSIFQCIHGNGPRKFFKLGVSQMASVELAHGRRRFLGKRSGQNRENRNHRNGDQAHQKPDKCALKSSLPDRFLGFKECQDEVMRYLVEVEGWDAHDKLCNRLMAHLEQAGENKAAKEEQYRHVEEDSGRQLTPMTVEPGVDTAAKYEDSKMNVEENSSSPYPSSNSSNKTDSGIKSSTHGSDKVLYKVPMDPNNYQTMDSISDKNDSSVYKFKHKITKRFSEEGKKIPQSDSSSSLGSNENTQRGIKRDMARHPRSLSSYISSSLYSNSDLNGNSSAGDSGSGEEPKITCPLPGFVLHPKGTHYVPMSIHPSNVGNDFLDKSKYEQNTKVFHPISIPVNFGGPLLYMKRVKEWKREISCPSDSRPDSGESRSGGPSSVENLSGNLLVKKT